jgi:hypothetical protein
LRSDRPLAIVSLRKSELENHFLDELTNVLTKRYEVYDRQMTDAVAAEINFQYGGDVSDEEQRQLGIARGAQLIISVAITDMGSTHIFQVRAIDVESRRIHWADSVTVVSSDQTKRLLTVVPAPQQQTPPPPPPPPPPEIPSSQVDLTSNTNALVTVELGRTYRRRFVSSNRVHIYQISVSGTPILTAFTEGDTDTVMSVLTRSGMQAAVAGREVSSADTLASDDDSGADYNSRLIISPAAPGTLYYMVKELGGRDGTYSFTLRNAQPGENGRVVNLESGFQGGQSGPVVDLSSSANLSVTAELGRTYRRSFSSSSAVHLYEVTVPQGTSFITGYTDGSLDTRIMALSAAGLSAVQSGQTPPDSAVLGFDDDSGSGYNARLSLSPGSNRTVYFMVDEYDGSTGSYTFTAQSGR